MKWMDKLIREIEARNTEQIIAILQDQATEHANTAPQKVKDRALKQIRKLLGEGMGVYELGIKLANSNNRTGEEIGSILIAEQYDCNPSEVESTLYRLADSSHWEVREWVASACAIVLSHHFLEFYRVMQGWTKDKSANVRRAVVVAVKYAAKTKEDQFCERLIDLLEPLLADSDPYVKKNLGAFAIGDGLLRYFPNQVLKRIHVWIEDDREQVRWNIAKVFSSAEGVKYIEKCVLIMDKLRMDKRVTVKRAVKSMLNAVKKRRPDIYQNMNQRGVQHYE